MERRRFSAALQGQNLRFTGAGEGGSARAVFYTNQTLPPI
ncbi:hypothetical protein, partial [Pseudomonas aeruginosa]